MAGMQQILFFDPDDCSAFIGRVQFDAVPDIFDDLACVVKQILHDCVLGTNIEAVGAVLVYPNGVRSELVAFDDPLGVSIETIGEALAVLRMSISGGLDATQTHQVRALRH